MKTIGTRAVAQGELGFLRLPDDMTIPKGAAPVAREGGFVVVGHSETGHFHYMERESTTLYKLPDDILKCLLVVNEPDTLKHLRDFDTHESIAFPPGKYEVTYFREETDDGWRRDVD